MTDRYEHIRNLQAERDALLDALRQITEWPDGGNRYGQENIKRFAQAAEIEALRAEAAEWKRAASEQAELRKKAKAQPLTLGDAKKLREFNHELADEVMKLKKASAILKSTLKAANEDRNHFARLYNGTAAQLERLKHERDEALTLVIRYQRLLECAVRSEEFVVGDAIFIGIDTDLADEIEESFDESPKAALAALKAQWQADILAEISLQVSASKPEATPMQIATAILDELKRIRQRAQEAVDE